MDTNQVANTESRSIKNVDAGFSGHKKFDCGNDVINHYVRNSLKKNVVDGNCAAKVLVDNKTGELLGVCSFTGYMLEKSRLSSIFSGSLPSELNSVRLVMLGVAKKHQNKGYGKDLLQDFFEQVKVIHKSLPVKGIYLDAHKDAVEFYKLLGFVELNEPPNSFGAIPMFLAIHHVIAA